MTQRQIDACIKAASLINVIYNAAINKKDNTLNGWIVIESSPDPEVRIDVIDTTKLISDTYLTIYYKKIKGKNLTSKNVENAVKEALQAIEKY